MRFFDSLFNRILGSLRKSSVILLGLLVGAAIVLAACSDQTPTKQSANNSSNTNSQDSNKTVAAPYPALASPTPQYTPMPTPTQFQPIPLLPTNTPLPPPPATPIVAGNNNAPVVPTNTFTTLPAGNSKPSGKTTPGVTVSATGLLAYIQGGNLWTINTDGTERKQITTSGDLNASKIIWSPNRDRLIYQDANNNLQLLQISGQKSQLFAPTPNQTLLDPIWSPSGRYVIFTLHSNSTTALTGGEIWLVDAIAPNFTPRRLVNGFSPSWSPDSKSFAYLTNVGSPNSNTSTPNATRQIVVYNTITIYTLDSNQSITVAASVNLPSYIGTDKQQHVAQAATFRAVWWSPDGKTIYYSDKQSFLGQVPASAGQLPKMLIGQPGAFAVNQMYWVGKAQIPLIEWDNAGETGSSHYSFVTNPGQITDMIHNNSDVSCLQTAPQTGLLAFSDNQSTTVLESNGNIYGRFAGGGCPSWSPDGKYLATVKQGGDGSIVLLPANAVNNFTLQTVKGVDTVYWVKGTATIVQQGGPGPNGP